MPKASLLKSYFELAKASSETKYWPIIRGKPNTLEEIEKRDPASILARVPTGDIREILAQRFQERAESLAEMMPEPAVSNDMDQLANQADGAGIYAFGGKTALPQWPADKSKPQRFSFQTVKTLKGNSAHLVLLRLEHSYDAPAYLPFGGWNECPAPELQVAILREWRKKFRCQTRLHHRRRD